MSWKKAKKKPLRMKHGQKGMKNIKEEVRGEKRGSCRYKRYHEKVWLTFIWS